MLLTFHEVPAKPASARSTLRLVGLHRLKRPVNWAIVGRPQPHVGPLAQFYSTRSILPSFDPAILLQETISNNHPRISREMGVRLRH